MGSVYSDLDPSIFVQSDLIRHKTYAVDVGPVIIGGGHDIVVQSMTESPASDYDRCVKEVLQLLDAGSELVRIALNNEGAAKNMPRIRDEVVKAGYDHRVLVGCGQYEIARLLDQYPECADAMGKYRINPGNIGFGDKRDTKFESVIKHAIKNNVCVRIGVNWGSLDKDIAQKLMDDNACRKDKHDANIVLRHALVLSSLTSAERAVDLGLPPDKIIISCKVSKVPDLVAVYTALARLSKFALHIGLTEAGVGMRAIASTSVGLALLLNQGIGDTLRCSLTPQKDEPRTKEVKLCQNILQALEMRSFHSFCNIMSWLWSY